MAGDGFARGLGFDMRTFVLRSLALVALTAAVPASAATFVRDAVIDVSAYLPGTTYSLNLGANRIAFDPVTVAIGDVVTGTVTFSGGRTATVSNGSGSELVRLLLSQPNFANTRATYSLTFNDVSGNLNQPTDPQTGLPTAFTGTSSGTAAGPTANLNLTDSTFSFSGFTYRLTYETAATNLDATNFGANRISFADPASAVPEPATWAMMLIGFGAIGGTMRRRVALRPQLA